MDMEKVYEPQKFESDIYAQWLEKGYFTPEINRDKKPFTIVIPPPNITGQLHMGHALDNAVQDCLIRYKRMQGYCALWLPGTDHASIATELKIVEQLKKDGLDKQDVGRERFLELAWEWKEKYGGRIVEQLKRLGSSCDWSREAFTLDEKRSKAVRHVFKKLYDKGLIYQGDRITNWCPECGTALSDAEVDYCEHSSHLWHFKYFTDDGRSITFATTRPETMLGDTAVAVNPDDGRYADFVGHTVKVPFVNRTIPIVADSYVEKDFGTGVVKITPAHDPNDFEVGLRHNLEILRVMNDDGTMNEKAGSMFEGLTREEARKKVVAEMDKLGQLVKIEDYTHNVGECYRCKTTVEPVVSKQWFVKMKPLAERAIKCVRDGEVNFVPARFEKIYFNWMENIRDWCISRQLWWGHRIPAYFLPEGGYVVAATPEEALKLAQEKTGNPALKIEDLRQDEDCLDTWFSSWFWPISLFDGINNPDNEEINYYYPTSDLVTGPDIIFFWVARMIMAGYEYRGKMPFKSVYFTGIVRDKLGRKMSKSLGNSPDPLQLIEQYGADGVRMGLMLAAPAGNDIPFDDALCEQGRNFNNKIWNAFRLVKGWTVDDTIAQPEASAIAVKWFKMQLDKTIAEVDDSFSKYRLSEAMMAVYKLFWDEFSSWYLEMVKPGYQQPIDKATYEATLGFFDALLRLLHPFMPFITEELWQALEPRKEGESLMVAQMPEIAVIDSAYLDAFEIVKEIVGGVRTIRLQKNIPNKDALELQIVGEHNEAFNAVIAKMCNLSSIFKVEEKAAGAVSFLVRTTEYAVPLGNLINVEEELAKLQEELKYQKGFLASVMKKLGNENFVSKAPAKVIEMEKKKQADAESKIKSIEESIAALTK